MKKLLLILVATLSVSAASAQEAKSLDKIVGILTYSSGIGLSEEITLENCAVDLGYNITNSLSIAARYEESLILHPAVAGVKSYESSQTLGAAARVMLHRWNWAGLELMGAGGATINDSTWNGSYVLAGLNIMGLINGKARGVSLGVGVRHNMLRSKTLGDCTTLNISFGIRW